jgi:hypothetical protein
MKAKRVAMGLLVAATPLLFAGCGAKKTITCEAEEDEMKANVKLVFNEKKHEFESGSIGITMDLSDYDKDEIEEIKDNAEDFCELLEGSLGFAEDCKSKVTSKEFKADFKVDIDELNEGFEEDEDIDDIVEALEKELNAECKVK